jgi:hypothetical protein
MKVQRNRDGRTVEVSRSEGEWLISHGYATAADDEAPKPKRTSIRKPKTSTQSDGNDRDGASSPSESGDSE